MTVACPHCEKRIANSPAVAGRVVKCPHCNRQFSMPQLEAPPIMSQTLRANVWLRRMLGRNGGKPNKAVFWLGGTVLLLIILIIGSSLARQKKDTLLSEDFRERAMTRDLKRERESLTSNYGMPPIISAEESLEEERRELLARQTHDSYVEVKTEESLEEERKSLVHQTQLTLKTQQARRKGLIRRIEYNRKKVQEIGREISKLFQETEQLKKKFFALPQKIRMRVISSKASSNVSDSLDDLIASLNKEHRDHIRDQIVVGDDEKKFRKKWAKAVQDLKQAKTLYDEISEKERRIRELESVREYDNSLFAKELRGVESLIRHCQDTLRRLQNLEQFHRRNR